jgi:hypothetical protein
MEADDSDFRTAHRDACFFLFLVGDFYGKKAFRLAASSSIVRPGFYFTAWLWKFKNTNLPPILSGVHKILHVLAMRSIFVYLNLV